MSRSTRIDWTNFYKVRDDDGKIVAAMCTICDKIIKCIAHTRLQKHRQTHCTLKTNCDAEVDENGDGETFESNPSKKSRSFHIGGEKSDRLKEDPEDVKKRLDRKLSLFFYGCSIPFNVVESKFFLDFVKALSEVNCSYRPPCRQTLSGPLLSRVHADIVQEKKKLLKNTDSVLLVDGWKNKNANRKYLVFTLRNIHVDQAFLSFEDYSLQTEHGDNLAASIQCAIKIAKDEYNTDVFAIITDNDSKIRCGAGLAKNNYDKDLYQCTCSSHSGNLLMKDIVSDDFTTDIKEIARIFGDCKYDSLIRNYGGTKVKNFPDTRFNYIRITCKSIVDNLHILRNICDLPDVVIEQSIIDRIRDQNFEIQLHEVINLIDPICKLINKCQDPSVNIADATELWMSLELPVNDHNVKVCDRINKAVWPVGCAANMLHPKYAGLRLNSEQKTMGHNFIHNNLNTDTASELQQFYNDTDTYGNLAHNIDCPIAFWSHCGLRLPNLSKFALKLMIIPASTALIESLFSNWTYIHTDYRNRLTDDTSGKLLDVYHSSRHLNIGMYETNEENKRN